MPLLGSCFASKSWPVWRHRRTTATNWLGRPGPLGSFGTECRAVLTSSPETWLCTRPDPMARPTPSCLALKLGSRGLPSTQSHLDPALVPSSIGRLHWASHHSDLGLATMDVDVGVPLQLLTNNLAHRCHTVGSTHHVDVVQESENFLGTQQPVKDRLQALVQTQAEEQRHEWVALLAAFSLRDVVCDPSIILPQIRRRAAVELTDERPQPVTAFHCHQPRLPMWPSPKQPWPSSVHVCCLRCSGQARFRGGGCCGTHLSRGRSKGFDQRDGP